MPLRHMIADALIYLKEYNELSAKNKREKSYSSSGEFLSGLTKTDRLHPVIGSMHILWRRKTGRSN